MKTFRVLTARFLKKRAIGRTLHDHFLWWRDKLRTDSLGAAAAQASFWVLISFLPFLMLLLLILHLLSLQDTPGLLRFVQLLPASAGKLVEQLIAELPAPGQLLPVTILGCIWPASTGMLAFSRGLCTVFQVPRQSYVLRRLLAIGYTLALAVILPVSIGLLVFGKQVFSFFSPFLSPAPLQLFLRLTPLLGFFILTMLFFLMYSAVSRKRVKPKNAWLGAVFAALGWLLFSRLFAIFVDNFSNYDNLYGSLAAIVILMIWLYAGMLILLVGGEAAMWLETLPLPHRHHDPRTTAEKGRTHHGKNTKK